MVDKALLCGRVGRLGGGATVVRDGSAMARVADFGGGGGGRVDRVGAEMAVAWVALGWRRFVEEWR